MSTHEARFRAELIQFRMLFYELIEFSFVSGLSCLRLLACIGIARTNANPMTAPNKACGILFIEASTRNRGGDSVRPVKVLSRRKLDGRRL